MNLNHERVESIKVSDVVIPDAFFNRFFTGEEGIDHIFGGGILPGSVSTIRAVPGAGKTTFVLSLAEMLTNQGYKVEFASGEESVEQIAFNCRRFGVTNTLISTVTDVDELNEKMDSLDVLIIDSYQCITHKEKRNKNQKQEYVIDNLVKTAKDKECALLFIVQETTDGKIKGGTTLPYAVDMNLEIAKDPKKAKDFRLFIVHKNRFGSTMEYEASLNGNGFTFVGEYNPEDEISNTLNGEPVSKVTVAECRKEYVLNMTEPPWITMDRVMQELDIQKQTAYNLLSDLVKEKKIVKYGFGKTAVWKRADITAKSFF